MTHQDDINQDLEKDQNNPLNTEGDIENQDTATENADKESEIDPFQKLQDTLTEVNDKYIRLVAEFDNYRKRMAKEKIETRLTAGQDILNDLIPVLDDLDRAEKAVSEASDVEAVKEGFALIKDKLVKNLAAKGLKEMEVHGEIFDADKHEAVAEFPAPSKDLKGKIFDVTEKGYLLNDRIIRFPKVVVSK
ncbi:MAG TPA: nucleotide exchange factor GrpE [Chitinophagales bacterium]|nr:nucleotide exchange factor GrpE [Chitinophagales bacterium]